MTVIPDSCRSMEVHSTCSGRSTVRSISLPFGCAYGRFQPIGALVGQATSRARASIRDRVSRMPAFIWTLSDLAERMVTFQRPSPRASSAEGGSSAL